MMMAMLAMLVIVLLLLIRGVLWRLVNGGILLN